MVDRIALLGGVYSNYLALDVAIRDIRRRGVEQIYCLGDLGAFGPHPDRVFPLLHKARVACVQGNYDDSIGNQLDDCQCGYTDPRDNHFAQLSYDYTLENTCSENREYLKGLPPKLECELGGLRVLLCHGSPYRTNEFLWESTTSDAYLQRLFVDLNYEVICATHTGIKWHRQLGDKHFVNVGVLGRPENDGTTCVWYTLIEKRKDRPGVHVQFVPVAYDFRRLAKEMVAEKLPSQFVETIMTGWWSTCLEILPFRERSRGAF